MKRFVIICLLAGILSGYAFADNSTEHFDQLAVPAPADYSNDSAWVSAPKYALAEKSVDVFFVHPTTFMETDAWNESMDEAVKNERTKGVLKTQAGVFADSCNIYMPHYRQASIKVLSADKEDNEMALDVAYEDVENAFIYYIENYNHGKPFILAGHSQGSELLLRLIKSRIDSDTFRKAMIAAYVIGWSVTKLDVENYPLLKLSESYNETGCVISYNTQTLDPAYSIVRDGAISVNPLLWNTSLNKAPKDLNLGAVLFDGPNRYKTVPHFTGAQNVNGALIIPEPDKKYNLTTPEKGFYHPYDYSFFYENLRQNVKDRIESYNLMVMDDSDV